ncbi:hypothetical protein [Microbulbifer sp. THAF38]|uniref:hypothetical protein n=1 Tax=Microbulbifer sp. THAF38 TaxID=2587856 RepID=UPI00126793A5|nr:hypothetical protein [Microbulbifer sp. THAF38]QFT55555.1 hypothetical protein FIU95_13455 [Microbulbifer sp. THAF38]
MKTLSRAAGISAISMALLYVIAFVFFGVFWSYPSDGSPAEKMTFLAEHQFSFNVIYTLMYLVFAVFLSFLVVGLYQRLKVKSEGLIAVGTLFGAIWVGLVIASGMIANIGLAYAIGLMEVNPEKAFDVWGIIYLMVESLGGGNELVGGLWVLVVSIVALQLGVFSKYLNCLGIFVGIAGVATIYPSEIFTEIFGISQIVWFIWIGSSLLGRENESKDWGGAVVAKR